MGNSKPSIQIDLNEFKLHLHLRNKPQRTFHFDSPSRRFYLSVIALVVNDMKKLGNIKSIPLMHHLDLLTLLNETIGGGAGSSDKENLLHRIYRKWKDALPNLEEAPLFKVLGKKKEEEGAVGKVYSFTEAEKDDWANLFEYTGSHENVRLRFSIDKVGASLEETSINFGDAINGEAWDRFISSLRKDEKERTEPQKKTAEEHVVTEPATVPLAPPKEREISWLKQYSWVLLVVVVVILHRQHDLGGLLDELLHRLVGIVEQLYRVGPGRALGRALAQDGEQRGKRQPDRCGRLADDLVKAAGLSRVARRASRPSQDEERIAVTVGRQPDQPQGVAGGLALAPQHAARTRVEVYLSRGQGRV